MKGIILLAINMISTLVIGEEIKNEVQLSNVPDPNIELEILDCASQNISNEACVANYKQKVDLLIKSVGALQHELKIFMMQHKQGTYNLQFEYIGRMLDSKSSMPKKSLHEEIGSWCLCSE